MDVGKVVRSKQIAPNTIETKTSIIRAKTRGPTTVAKTGSKFASQIRHVSFHQYLQLHIFDSFIINTVQSVATQRRFYYEEVRLEMQGLGMKMQWQLGCKCSKGS